MDEFAQLIGATGRLLGIETLEPDADGVVEIVSEDAAISVIRAGDAGDMVLMTSNVVAASESAPDAMRRALEANVQSAAGGATVSLDPDDGSFVLSDYLPLRVVTPEGLVAKLEEFASALSEVRDLLSGRLQPETDAVHDSSDVSGFMMV